MMRRTVTEQDRLIGSYVHLGSFPRAAEALHTLKKIASMVKPIMRARSWQVKELAEFYPDDPRLLGLNVDRGRKILVRLRYAGDKAQFMPLDQVLDTMLHELCHIVHGPHDSKFHALWDQLRDEWQGLALKGFTGEGFLSEGRRLGGSGSGMRQSPPAQEARRLARAAATQRAAAAAAAAAAASQQAGSGSGRRLGGGSAARPRPGDDMRRVIADAAQRRNKTLQGCATDNLTDGQIRSVTDSASANGFRTKAEEDEANEAAISQALWELMQEEQRLEQQQQRWWQGSGDDNSGGQGTTAETFWECDRCTLHNESGHLACQVCGATRPLTLHRPAAQQPEASQATAASSAANPWTSATATRGRPEVFDLTESPPRRRSDKRPRAGDGPTPRSSSSDTIRPPPPPPPPQQQQQQRQQQQQQQQQTWVCRYCTTRMERKWWTCSSCGRMKDNSR